MLKLYSYFRSSASYRARIALHYKGLPFEYIPVHLLQAQQRSEEYAKINPMQHVPALMHDGFLIAETVAIIQYLDEVFPERPLLPKTPREKALVMQICEVLNSGIQPLQNLKVMKYLETETGLSKERAEEFVRHWILEGMTNLERLLSRTAGTYSFGGVITAADAFLVPQCFSCKRFGVEVEAFPTIARVNANATKLESFQKAHPEKQPDYQA